MKVKGTGSMCLLQECVKDCCREMNLISRLNVNFLDSTQNIDKSVERELRVKGTGSRFLLKECAKDNYYARFHPHS